VARGQGASGQKASAQLFRIADFGFFWFSFSIRIPQSAFRNLDARPVHEMEDALVFAPEGPCPRAWHPTEGHLSVVPIVNPPVVGSHRL